MSVMNAAHYYLNQIQHTVNEIHQIKHPHHRRYPYWIREYVKARIQNGDTIEKISKDTHLKKTTIQYWKSTLNRNHKNKRNKCWKPNQLVLHSTYQQ